MVNPDLDWTFGPAPAADDPAPNTPPRRPARPNPAAALRLSRRTWLLLGAVTVAALAILLLLPRYELARTQQAVEQVVAAQEAARLAGDWDTLGATFAQDGAGWGAVHLQRLRNGWLPTPIRLPGLRSDEQPGQVIDFQTLAPAPSAGVATPALARVDVARGFVLADGQPATFAMPQFYRFVSGAWRQAPPPALTGDDGLHLHGQRVDLSYYGDDGNLAVLLAGDLDSLLARACADWGCPPELHVAVVFDAGDPASAASPPPYADLLGSLTLQLILDHPSAYPAYQVSLASSFAGGYPTNAAATNAVRHAAGVQALVVVAQQLAPNTLQHGENAYLDAMIAREAARLGIDAPGVLSAQLANPLYRPVDLWSVPLLHASSAPALPQALVLLNKLLAHSDLTVEQRLMHAFNTAPNAPAWLAAGLGLTPDATQLQLEEDGFSFPTLLPVTFTPDFALTCPAGPYLGTLGGQATPLLDGEWPGSPVEAWSPNGRFLTLRLAGWLGTVDLVDHAGGLYQDPSFDDGTPPVWATNNLFVYPSVRPNRSSNDTTGNQGLTVVGAPGGTAFWPDDSLYVPSPNGAWAAVVGDTSGSSFALRVIPAQGGPAVYSATLGYNPAWSADSQHLVFAVRSATDATLYGLAVLDLGSHYPRMALNGIDPGVPALPAGATAGAISLFPAWSPAGDRLAVAALTSVGQQVAGWAGLMSLDGSALKLLPPVQPRLAPFSLAYSADGLFLAVSFFDSRSSAHGVGIYSAAGQLLRWLPGAQAGPWSLAGHTLALINLAGVSLLPRPDVPDAKPQAIGPARCTGLVWKP